MRPRSASLCLLLIGAVSAGAQQRVEVRNNGTGVGPEALELALRAPHIVAGPGTTPYAVARGTSISESVIVIGRDAIIDGTVHGDVIVVSADLYMHPGGRIDGRALALGGGVYQSSLATIGSNATSFRDFTYDISQSPWELTLTYRQLEPAEAATTALPGLVGLRVPSYDRTNGVSIPASHSFDLLDSRVALEPRIAYRSQLGRLDPGAAVTAAVGRDETLRVSGERGTFSNDEWIAGNLLNSLETLWSGDDARDYFRAARGDASLAKTWRAPTTTIAGVLGARWERDRSVRPDSFAPGGPWTFVSRHDRDDELRPNPPINPGDLASALAGATLQWTDQGITAHARVDEEVGHLSPSTDAGVASATFAQTTLDGAIQFPTFRTQSIHIHMHGIYSTPGTPRQRWAYLGGVGSIPTLDLLSVGGNELLYFDGRYIVPLPVTLPFGAAPTVMLREVLGGAAVNATPTLSQATGVRIALSVLYGEILVDPATRKAHFYYGLSIAR